MTTQKPTSDGLDNREPEIGALADTDLEKVTGGDNTLQHEAVTGQAKTVGLGLRKSAGGNVSGVLFL